MKTDRQNREQEILTEFRTSGRTDKLIQEYWNLVYLTVRSTLIFHKVPFTHGDIEDLRNEVFVQMLNNNCRRLRQYSEGKGLSLSGWIRLIANQTTLNEIRKNGMLDMGRRNFRISAKEIGEIEKFVMPDMENRLDAKEKLKLIEKLSPRDRDTLTEYYFRHRSLQEIADARGENYGTVSKIIHDAKKRLKKLIEEMMSQ